MSLSRPEREVDLDGAVYLQRILGKMRQRDMEESKINGEIIPRCSCGIRHVLDRRSDQYMTCRRALREARLSRQRWMDVLCELRNCYLDQQHRHSGDPIRAEPQMSSTASDDSFDLEPLFQQEEEEEVASSLYDRVKSYVWRYFSSGARSARGIGISAKRHLLTFINTVISAIRPALGTFGFIIGIMKRVLITILDSILIMASSVDSARGYICSAASLILVGVAICLPQSAMSTYGRFIFGGLGLLTAFSQSYMTIAISAGIAYAMSFFVSKYSFNINIKNDVAVPQNTMIQDTKTLLIDIATLGVLTSAATTGVALPHDKKTWVDFMNRHVLVKKAIEAWDFGAEKLCEIFDRISHYVFKHLLGKEYTSASYISEIETLYADVMTLCRLDVNLQIGRDPQLAVKIEQMYLRYLSLCRTYAANRTIMSKLVKLGGPLTEFYRRVTDKNPKAHVMRLEPVCVALRGATGIGKSYLMNRFQQDLLKICGKFNPDHAMESLIYARAIEQEFWDGYVGQPIVVYDDFGQKVDSQGNPNLEFFEIIRSVNIFAYPLHAAAMQDKANTPFTSDFVILTTNLENYRVESIKSKEAFERRIHLDMKVKIIDEVSDLIDGNNRLNPGKLRTYQMLNSLPQYDMSHLIFTDKDGHDLSYDDFVRAVSIQYRKHKEAFECRQEDNAETATQYLPPGCYTSDPRWIAQPQGSFTADTDSTTTEYSDADSVMTEYSIPNSSQWWDTDAEEEPQFEYRDFVRATRPVPSIAFHMEAWNTFNAPRMLNHSSRRFNGLIRRYFLEPVRDRSLRNVVVNLWSDLEAIRIWWRSSPIKKIITFSVWASCIFAGVKLCKRIYNTFVDDKQEDNLKAPFITTLLNAAEDMVNIVLVASPILGNHEVFITIPLLTGATLRLSRLVFRDILYHTLLHSLYESGCEICTKHKTMLASCAPSAKIEDPQTMLTRYNNIEKNLLEVESEARISDTIDIESPTKVQVKGKMCRIESAEEESPMRSNIVKKRILVEAAEEESPMRSGHARKVMNIEMDAKLKKMFPDIESGRALDEKKKRKPICEMAEAEGLRCAQTEMLKATIRRNTWIMEAHYDDVKEHVGFVTCIKGRKAVINNHYFEYMCVLRRKAVDKDSFRIFLKQANMEGGHYGTLNEIVLSSQPVFRGQHQTEFYMIDLPKSCNFGRDLTKHLIDAKKANSLVRGVALQLVTYRSNGKDWEATTVAGPLEKIHKVELPDLLDESKFHIYMESAYYGIPTQKGDCGSCVLIDSNEFPRKILGFHFAGMPGKGIASIITHGDIMDMVKDEPCLAETQNITLKEMENFPLKSGSFLLQGEATVKISHPCKTSLQPSLVHGLFGEPKMKPALLAPPLTPGGPMIQALMKNAGNVLGGIDSLRLSEVKRDYFDTNIAPFPPLEIEQKILTFKEACMGIEGNDFFPPIKRGKSAGYPYMAHATRGKRDWFGEDEWDFSSAKCKQLRTDVHNMIEAARHGIVPEAVFVATLKDEKRLNEKVDAGKTRVFSACPQHYLIAFRQYFAGFIAFMGRNKINNESAIGTNCHGYDWKEIVRHLTPWQNQNICAGDFKEFDGTFQPEIFDMVCDIINDFYQGTPDENRIRKSLWRALVNPMHVLDYFIFSFSHGQPSGSPITAISNSVYLSLSFRYVLYPLLKHLGMSFKNHIRLIAYGDDSLISFSPHLAKHVTPFMLMQLFQTIGMKYTSALKDQYTEDDKFQQMHQVSFLKRGFVLDKKLNHWFAPLDLVSIEEQCNWIRKGPSDEQATIDNCSGALQELCHHSKEKFEEYSQVIIQACKDNALLMHIPDWNCVRTQMSMGQIDYMSEDRPFV